MLILGVALPIGWMIISAIVLYLGRGHRWRRSPVYLLWIANFGAIWVLTAHAEPSFFFLCCGLACVTGVLWAVITILRVYDLLLGRFARQYTLIMDVFSLIWWLTAITIFPG